MMEGKLTKECKVSEKKDKKKKKKLKKKHSEAELGKDDGIGKIKMKQSKEGKNAEKDITRKKKRVKIRADDTHDGDNSAQEVILKQKKRKKKKRRESDEVNEEKVLKKRKGEESVFVETVKGDSRCVNLLAPNDDEKVKFSHSTKIKNEKNSKNKRTKSDNGKIDLPPHRFILAPMVGGSELAFRLLCRRYGTELAYTPMMNSEKFAVDAQYRDTIFQTNDQDRPLVAHFSANCAKTLLAAAKLVEHQCDAIDLNLGCPQRIAHSGHFGSYLLGEEDRDLVLDIVRTVSRGITIPMFVKIRLLDSIADTVKLCKQLESAGAALIAVHGRYRVNLVGRSGPGARDGPAHLDQIKTIKESIKTIPIIANGNIITASDAQNNLIFTGADGVMSAEGILDDPSLFYSTQSPPPMAPAPCKLTLGLEYLDLVEKHPVPLKSVIFHIRRICKKDFENYQLLEDCLRCTTIESIRHIILTALAYVNSPETFVFDPYKEQRRKELLAQKKREEGKRKAYEARMIRKSKREGKDINYYLNIGAKNPTQEIVDELKAMKREEAFEIWKKDHSQHCFSHHFDEGGCKRDRTCAFLHADVTVAEAIAYG